MVRKPHIIRPNGKLHLSDTAYLNIEGMLIRQEFIKPDSKTQHKKMSVFLEGLETWSVQWEDARPVHIKAQDSIARHYGLAPMWNTGEPHICHDGISAPIAYLTNIAHRYNIQTFLAQLILIRGVQLTRPRAYRPPQPYAIASAVVEAIGLGWLRPTSPLPLRAVDRETRRVKLILDTRTYVL